MAEHPRDRDVVTDRERTTHTTHTTDPAAGRTRGGRGIAAVVGGLVVAVLLMFWLFSAGDNEAEISETAVTIEETETAADTGAATEETVGMGSEAETEQPVLETEVVEEPVLEEPALDEPALEEPVLEETETAN